MIHDTHADITERYFQLRNLCLLIRAWRVCEETVVAVDLSYWRHEEGLYIQLK